jgi:regulator of replication initiation timing
MKKQHVFPKEDDDKVRDTLQKLKSRNRKLTKENKILKSENETLQRALERNFERIKELTEDIDLEDLIDGKEKHSEKD